MGSKYTVQAWGKHFGEDRYSNLAVHAGQRLVPALWALWMAKRKGYGCVALEVRA